MKKYSIVCYLEGDVLRRVRTIQEELRELTGSRKCIDSWMPHITVGSGIVVPEGEQDKVDALFEGVAQKAQSFDIELKGFGGTETWGGARLGITTPYVLWIEPIKTGELQNLFEMIKKEITDSYDTFYPRMIEYVPHVTVAYGDLTQEGYVRGKEYLAEKGFEDVVKIDHIALVENFDDKDVEYRRFPLEAEK